MKLNKKGFTLIELLGVVVIMLMISVLAVSSISSAIERNKAKQDAAKIDLIISYAKLYYDEHKNTVSISKCIDMDDLELSDSEKKDANGNTINGVIEIDGNEKFSFNKNRSSCS